MSSFDYLKSAIKQKGCTLQQVAGWSFPADRKASAWCLVSFTRCIPGIST